MRRIYLDHTAGKPIDERVLNAMIPYFSHDYGNPSSPHYFGNQARTAIDDSRISIAELIGAEKKEEIIFTSGGTESNNFALLGCAFANKSKGNHIITTSIEHPSVLKVFNYLSNCGFDIDYMTVDSDGKLNLNQIKALLRSETILVSIMMVNNETGCILPVKEIGEFVSKKIFYSILMRYKPLEN